MIYKLNEVKARFAYNDRARTGAVPSDQYRISFDANTEGCVELGDIYFMKDVKLCFQQNIGAGFGDALYNANPRSHLEAGLYEQGDMKLNIRIGDNHTRNVDFANSQEEITGGATGASAGTAGITGAGAFLDLSAADAIDYDGIKVHLENKLANGAELHAHYGRGNTTAAPLNNNIVSGALQNFNSAGVCLKWNILEVCFESNNDSAVGNAANNKEVLSIFVNLGALGDMPGFEDKRQNSMANKLCVGYIQEKAKAANGQQKETFHGWFPN